MSDTAPKPEGRRSADMRVLRKVAPYLWPKDQPWVRQRVVIALSLLVLSKVASVITPLFYKAAVDAMTPATPDASWLGLGAVGLTLAYGMARIMANGFQQLRDVVFARVTQRGLRRLARETFEHIHALSLRYHITRKTGGLSRIVERGVKGVEFLLRFLLFSIGPLMLELLMIAVILFVLFDVWYLAVVVGTIGLYILFTFRVTEMRVRIRRRMMALDTEASQKAVDSLLNFETVKYFNAEAREAERYDASMAGYERAALETAWSLGALNFGQAVLINGGLIAVMVMSAQGVAAGTLTVGDFVMVNAYMIQITMPLNFLGTVYREIRQALVDMGDMFTLLEQPPEIRDAPDAAPLAVCGGQVRFDAVRFGYNADREILRGVSLDVPAGTTLAVVGPSGSGKSTLGRLLFRFYDVTGGALSIDGLDVRAVTQTSLRDAIGVVPQDTVLFNDSIRYNIAYGRADASDAQIEAAAKAARIHDFVMSLPEGYDTQVGERGLKLSGGEKQRVGIARTMLKNPPILLLDEATSALDTDTERAIQMSLREMSKGRTVITIAHRLSTVVDADKIVVLARGQVAEEGTHTDLLARRGPYWQMWQAQGAEGQGPLP